MYKLHDEVWILKVSKDSIWFCKNSGEVIKFYLDNTESIKLWLDEPTKYPLPKKEVLDELLKNQIVIKEPKTKFEIENIAFFEYSNLPYKPDQKTIHVVIIREVDLDLLQDIDEWSHENKIPWMPLGLLELSRIGFGPLVIPFETACINCWITRRASHSSITDVNLRFKNNDTLEEPLIVLEENLLKSLVEYRAKNLQRFVRLMNSTVFSMDRTGNGIVEDKIIRAPRCSRCFPRYGMEFENWLPIGREQQ